MLARARRVICESGQVKNDIKRFFGLAEERATVITAPPQKQFVTARDARELAEVRHRLQLPARFAFYPAQFWPIPLPGWGGLSGAEWIGRRKDGTG